MERTSSVSPLRILLVEDNEHDRLAFRRAFQQSGVRFDITECVRAEEAFPQIQADHSSFDVVVVDHKLPGMSGLEFCKELLGQELTLPLVILTGKGSERLAVEALKAGVYDYLIKDPADGHLDLLPVVLQGVVRKHAEHTARQQAEVEIRRSKTMLQAVFDGISDPLIMLDSDLVVKRLNRSAALYYQVDFKDVIGKPCHVAFRGEAKPCEGCAIPPAVSGGRSVTLERRGFADPARLEQVVIYPVRQENSQEGAAIVRISDITDVRVMEVQLMRTEKLASIGRLAAGVAHEINNPLAVINEEAGYMQDLFSIKKRDGEEHDMMEHVDSILESVERCGEITKQLLGFARHFEVDGQPIKVKEVILDVISFQKKEAEYRDIKIRVEVPEGIPDITTDRGKFQQIFMNLVNNAFQAMDRGGSLDISASMDKPEEVTIVVSDTGCGMPQENLNKIFEPFFTTKGHKGTGLGLSITYGLVRKLGGKISVQSELGAGTRFTIVLPIKFEGEDKDEDESSSC